MRAATCWILSLAWLALWCATAADAAAPPDSKRPVKPSSLAPHNTGHNHVYGAPIQKPILRYHPKPKPQLKSEPQLKGEPQLKSEPLPQLKSAPLPQG